MHHQLLLRAHAGITNFEEVGAADRLTADGVVFLKHKAFSATEIEYCGPDQTILYGSKRLEVEFMCTHMCSPNHFQFIFPSVLLLKKSQGNILYQKG